MKTNFYTLIFMLVSSCLCAQTLKNIYRNNKPVLRIPTHLIDRVETVDINGVEHLRVLQFSGFSSDIPLSEIDSIKHSEGQAVDPSLLGEVRTASVSGVVRDHNNSPIYNAMVQSPFGGDATYTDFNGVFILNNIPVFDKIGFIRAEKNGFHIGSRSFLPLEEGSSRVNIQLLPMVLSGTFSSSTGGTVNAGLLQLSFPSNAIQLNGQPYNGTVHVYAQTLDPSTSDMFDQMPGELLGAINDSLQMLRSFGMASVELRNANMQKLQLAPGSAATLTFTIPENLLDVAPESTYWWSFDEEQGLWVHEGTVQKQGNQYVGVANHFTWWNVDYPNNFNDFEGVIFDLEGNPVSGAQINVESPSMGVGITFTNAEGAFSGRIPKNETLTLNVYLPCNTTGELSLALSESIVSLNDNISQTYNAGFSAFYPVSGNITNCQGGPVASGYVKIGTQIYMTTADSFRLWLCNTGLITLRAFDASLPDSVFCSEIISATIDAAGLDLGSIEACSQGYGSVYDADGNIYTTVLIGTQLWMAENLRTAHFDDGSEIPNIIANQDWMMASAPAWCYYNNNSAYETTYGKLYNWLAVSDPRKLCPTGWHVPSVAEWDTLRDNLGGYLVAGGKLKVTGTQFWVNPNVANNESGFSALGAGYRNVTNGTFVTLGTRTYFWTSTEASTETAQTTWLMNTHELFNSTAYAKMIGFSVRCLSD